MPIRIGNGFNLRNVVHFNSEPPTAELDWSYDKMVFTFKWSNNPIATLRQSGDDGSK